MGVKIIHSEEPERKMNVVNAKQAQAVKPYTVEDFLWGLGIGSVITVAAGGVLLYYGWPYVLAGIQAIDVFNVLRSK